MAIRKYDISLDTKVRISNVVIRGRLGDGKGSIVANVTVFNDGQRYNFTGLTPQYEAKLSDDLNIIRDKAGFSEVKAAEGSFTYEFPAELFSAEGYAKASYFTFLDDTGSKQSTFDIAVEVVGMALDGKLAETYVSEIDAELEGLTAEVTTAATAANKVISDIAKNNVQVPKITADNGSSLTLSQYDLLNTTDIFNFDGYVTSAPNAPTSVSSGFFKRKIRTGYIEVIFSPYNANALYRNAYHFGNKTWFGWEKIAYQSESATTQKQKITADNGEPKYDLSASTDLFAEAVKWGNGVHTFYLSAGATNNPTSSNSYVTGVAQFYGNSGGINVFDRLGRQFYAARTGASSFGAWQDYSSSDTGWIPFSTISGVRQNLQFRGADDNGFDCAYRVVTQQGVTTKHLRVNVENITASGTVLAKLPAGFIKNAQPFSPRTPRNKMAATVVPRANGDIIAITPDGWIATDYLYGSFSWID